MSDTVEKIWQEIRHPKTKRLMGKYCPQTHEAEFVDRGERAVVKLPEKEKRAA